MWDNIYTKNKHLYIDYINKKGLERMKLIVNNRIDQAWRVLIDQDYQKVVNKMIKSLDRPKEKDQLKEFKFT